MLPAGAAAEDAEPRISPGDVVTRAAVTPVNILPGQSMAKMVIKMVEDMGGTFFTTSLWKNTAIWKSLINYHPVIKMPVVAAEGFKVMVRMAVMELL